MKTHLESASLGVSDLARALGVKTRRIEGWLEKGLLKPAVAAEGTGYRHRFTRDHVLLGSLLLDIQTAFGTKKPLSSRVAKILADREAASVMHSYHSHHTPEADELLVVVHEGDKVTSVERVTAPKLGTYVSQQLQKSRRSATVFNVSAIRRYWEEEA